MPSIRHPECRRLHEIKSAIRLQAASSMDVLQQGEIFLPGWRFFLVAFKSGCVGGTCVESYGRKTYCETCVRSGIRVVSILYGRLQLVFPDFMRTP